MKSGIICSLAIAAVALSANAAPGGNKPQSEPTVGGINVFSNGQLIGYLLHPGVSDGDPVGIISRRGYLFEVMNDTGEIRPDGYTTLFFVGTGCTGDAYMSDGWKSAQGFVLPTLGTPGLDFAYYSLRGSQVEYVQYASYLSSANVCETSLAWAHLRRAYPNDPTITGVANENYLVPLMFGIP